MRKCCQTRHQAPRQVRAVCACPAAERQQEHREEEMFKLASAVHIGQSCGDVCTAGVRYIGIAQPHAVLGLPNHFGQTLSCRVYICYVRQQLQCVQGAETGRRAQRHTPTFCVLERCTLRHVHAHTWGRHASAGMQAPLLFSPLSFRGFCGRVPRAVPRDYRR